MECDSAYSYQDKNMFEAFGHVHLYKEGNDSVDIRSDFLRHNGNLKMAYFRKNVVLKDTKVVLTTDSLDYDINRNIGYYVDGAKIVDSATTLTSRKGYYYERLNTVFFKDTVKVSHNNGEYQMFTDTVKYNTLNETIYFFGPTRMVNDTNNMYAEFGWYDTKNDVSMFKRNAKYTNPKQSIVADSLFIDRHQKYGIGYSNVTATDTSQNLIIKGDFLEVHKEPEQMLVTKNALLINIVGGDSLFIHADTIQSMYDSTGTYRLFKAYHHVKFFKTDLQAKTDSLFFSLEDSILEMHGSPVLWTQQTQITGDYIEGYIVNSVLERFQLFNAGLIVSEQDTLHFNQIKGNEMIGYFRNNELYKIDVTKKSETIYFPTDDDEIVGVNKTRSNNITLLMKNNKVHRIIYREKPESTMYPLEDLREKEMKVKEFIWLPEYRPLIPADVFLWKTNSDNHLEIAE